MLLVSNREKFSDWLENQIKNLGWSQADLSRESGLHRAIISKIILGSSKPSPETLESLARALNLPPAQVFQAAGILPKDPDSDPLVEEGLHILQQLEGEEKEDALRYLRLRRQVQEERGKNARNKKRAAATG